MSQNNDGWEDVPAPKQQADDWEDVAHGPGTGSFKDKMQAILLGTGPSAPKVVQGEAPLALPGGALPKVAALGAKLGGSFLGRTAASAAQGGVTGALKAPQGNETRLGNAVGGAEEGALLSAGMETAVPIAKGIGRFLQPVANLATNALTGMSTKEVGDYVKNSKLAEVLHTLRRDRPEELDEALRQKVGNVLRGDDSLYEQVSKPTMEAMNKKLVGKTIQVNPKAFEGTAAQPVIEDAANKLGVSQRGLSVPVEPASTPSYVDPSQSVSVSEPNYRGGPLSLTPQQALRASRAAGDAAYGKKLQAQAGIGVFNPTSDVDAIAQHNLSSGIKGAGGPEVEQMVADLQNTAQRASDVKRLFGTNPSRILSHSETALGQVPAQATRNFLDENLGTNFNGLSDALHAGQAINNPAKVNDFLSGLIRGTGRLGVKAAGASYGAIPQGLKDALPYAAPMARQKLFQE